MNAKQNCLAFIDELLGSLSCSGAGLGVGEDLRVREYIRDSSAPRNESTVFQALTRGCCKFYNLSRCGKMSLQSWSNLDRYGKQLGLTAFWGPGEDRFITDPAGNLEMCLWLARSELEVIYDYLGNKVENYNFGSQIVFLVKIMKWNSEDFIAHAKYHCVWPMAKYSRNPLPDRPVTFKDHPFVWSGPILRMLKSRLCTRINRSNLRVVSLFWSMFQGVKRGCMVVPDSFVDDAKRKHLKSLSKNDEISPLTLTSEFLEFWSYKNFSTKPRLFEASVSASYENSRSKGGSRAFLWDEAQDMFGNRTDFVYNENGLRQTGSSGYTVREVTDLAWDVCNENRINTGEIRLPARVGAVCEPLKVRLVTAGPSYPYYLSRYLQKDMWLYLQKFRAFKLTGSPLVKDDLLEFATSSVRFAAKLDYHDRLSYLYEGFWVSGDYKGATDSLKIQFTKECFESLLFMTDNLSFKMKEIMRAVLYEHRLEYAISTQKDLIGGFQGTGQLMGSTLSFPILCVVNFMCLIRAYRRRFPYLDLYSPAFLDEAPVLINGDDILFRADRKLYEIWNEEIKNVGFELSLGKNYCHRNLMSVNSQMWYCNTIEMYSGILHDNSMSLHFNLTKVNYLNVGLLIGQSKVQKVEDQLSVDTTLCAGWYNECIPNCLEPERAHKRFLHYNMERIINETSYNGKKSIFNFFGDIRYGSCGAKPVIDVRYTRFQLKVAELIDRSTMELVDLEPPGLLAFIGDVRELKPSSVGIRFKKSSVVRNSFRMEAGGNKGVFLLSEEEQAFYKMEPFTVKYREPVFWNDHRGQIVTLVERPVYNHKWINEIFRKIGRADKNYWRLTKVDLHANYNFYLSSDFTKIMYSEDGNRVAVQRGREQLMQSRMSADLNIQRKRMRLRVDAPFEMDVQFQRVLAL